MRMVKLSRIEILKSEEDVKRVAEEIEKSMDMQQHNVAEESEVQELNTVAHQLEHIQELLIHIIQSIRGVRDSIDSLTSVIRKNIKVMALAYMLPSINDEEIRRKILEILIKDLELDKKS